MDLITPAMGPPLNTEVVAIEKTYFDCPRCGLPNKERHPVDIHLCIDCVKAENNRLTYYRQNQKDWLEKAAEAGLDSWLQQPGETQWEYTVWTTYRDSYPGKKPTYNDVAKQLGTTSNVVRKIAQRWSFPVRMQAWMVNIDQLTLTQRRQEILDMNKKHIDMAKAVNEKLAIAISAIEPMSLKPGEIVQLSKMAAELERKALEDTIRQEDLRAHITSGNTENPELKKSITQNNDLAEVVAILAQAGALGDLQITNIGVRQTETKTTEVVVHNQVVQPGSERQVIKASAHVVEEE